MTFAFAQTSNPAVQAPVPPSDQDFGLFHSLAAYLTSPEATAIGWLATILGVVLAVIPFALYIKEKRANKALQEIFADFEIRKRLEENLSKTKAQKRKMESQSTRLKNQIQKFENDIKGTSNNYAAVWPTNCKSDSRNAQGLRAGAVYGAIRVLRY